MVLIEKKLSAPPDSTACLMKSSAGKSEDLMSWSTVDQSNYGRSILSSYRSSQQIESGFTLDR